MNIQKNKSIMAVSTLLLMLLNGCNGSSNSQIEKENDASTPSALSGELITESSREVVNASSLVDSNTKFNSDLYMGLKQDGDNLFYSSYSIFSALSMTYAGAMNATKQEFETVLHYDDNLSVHESFASLLSQSHYEHNIFNIANSIWPQIGYPFTENFIYTVFNGYDSEITYKDYINDFEGARLSINDWVEEKTQDKIIDLIPKGALDDTTRMVLVNALYFKGTWEYEFDKNDTDKQPFYLSNNVEKEVDMMHMESELKYSQYADFKMLELPYKENEFSMLLCLPNSNELMENMEDMLFNTYSPLELKEYMDTQNVKVSLPKFKIKWGTKSIKKFLMAQGMNESFDGTAADFTGMWHRQGDENLYIADVLHQTFIEVNEEGAEAAAATAVIVSVYSGSSTPDVATFNADHPFIFFIVDNKTGMIIFSGKLENPEV